MKRLLVTITLIMAFGLTAYAGHNTNATNVEDCPAQSPATPGHEGVAFGGHAN